MVLSLFSIFSSSFLLALSGALMPGPVLSVTVSESARRGARVGPLIILGHGILELLLVLALLAGLAPVIAADNVFVVVSLSGGVILLWMSYTMFRSLPGMKLSVNGDTQKPRNLVAAGILLSIANPYWTIWWATIGIGSISYSMKFGTVGIFAFYTGHILADLAWYSMISLGISKGRHLFTDIFYRRLIGFCAGFLLFFSIFFFYSGIEKIV
ncbi:MAG: LysE family transporter [Desulfocapsaceae bacterium]|jgi:threonine/homoserine/homoserine lactone efflux protein|nr:LysE family transporter [Desulfocapsaceae bacterium]